MPTVRVEWQEGRSSDEKRKVANLIADSVSGALQVGKDRVTVLFTEYAKENMSKGGQFPED